MSETFTVDKLEVSVEEKGVIKEAFRIGIEPQLKEAYGEIATKLLSVVYAAVDANLDMGSESLITSVLMQVNDTVNTELVFDENMKLIGKILKKKGYSSKPEA